MCMRLLALQICICLLLPATTVVAAEMYNTPPLFTHIRKPCCSAYCSLKLCEVLAVHNHSAQECQQCLTMTTPSKLCLVFSPLPGMCLKATSTCVHLTCHTCTAVLQPGVSQPRASHCTLTCNCQHMLSASAHFDSELEFVYHLILFVL